MGDSRTPTLGRSAINSELRRIKMPTEMLSPHLTSLSPTSLVRSLVLASRDVESLEKPQICQVQNMACLTRRIKLLSLLFIDMNDNDGGLVPPSAMLCLKDLLVAIQRTKILLQDLNTDRSRVWNLMETESIARKVGEINRDMARALDMLPLGLLEVSEEVREHAELVRKQAKKTSDKTRWEVAAEAEERSLKRELDEAMRCFEIKKTPDPKRLRLVFQKLGLCTAADYRDEIRKLREEIAVQAGAGGAPSVVSAINDLIGLVMYAKCVLFGVMDEEEYDLAPACSATFQEAARKPNSTKRHSRESSSSSPSMPEEFKCPISLDMMRDPVIVATGLTYERGSIQQWLQSGHNTCPATGQKLLNLSLTSNYALRSLIRQFCGDQGINVEAKAKDTALENLPNSPAALEAVKMTASFLVGKLATGSSEVQKQAACELRLLSKCGMENRRCVAEAGAIPFLLPLLSSADSKAQENAVTAILNLSIYSNNKTLIMAAPGALDAIVEVLRRGGSVEARENAAATLFSLSVSAADDNKATIGSRPGAIPALLSLLQEGTPGGKKDAAMALLNLSLCKSNRPIIVAAGAVPVLVDLLKDETTTGITEKALGVLRTLGGCAQGSEAISNASAVPTLIDLIRVGSEKEKENSIAVLSAMCKSAGEDMVRRLAMLPQTIQSLKMLEATGSPRAKEKAKSILKLIDSHRDRQRYAADDI